MSELKIIKSVWIEIRPALKCCHFCVVLNNVNFNNNHPEVKIKLKKTNLLFDVCGNEISVNFKDFTVEPLTMSAFNVTNKYLSFRVQAECDFKFEKQERLKPFSPSFGKEKTNILCQCLNPLTNELIFDRVLPLPSTEFSFSEMFCHPPSDTQKPNTNPRLGDCFYSDDLIVINKERVIGCTRKDKFLKCKRCLNTVGISDKNAEKFWITCIKLPLDFSTPLDYLKRLICKAISNPVAIFPKILLECLENDTYLSMVIIDKNLLVSTCQEDLILKNTEVVKLKYKFHSSCDSEVKLLKDDPFHSLSHVIVHQSILDYSTKYLISCSKTTPSIFSKVDNECMAYLNL